MKDINIKLELASKVLGREVKDLFVSDRGQFCFHCTDRKYFIGTNESMDIHRFTAMCKEYVFQTYDLIIWTCRRQAKLNITGIWKEMPRFTSDKGDSTDTTAILKATDWVLNAEEWNT